MKNQMWPEGEQFTKTVQIPTNYDPLPVEFVFTVPSFDKVIETWQNREPVKAFPLLRQFLIDWDQEEKLSDVVLKMYLSVYPGTSEAIFEAWSEHMKGVLAENISNYPVQPVSIN